MGLSRLVREDNRYKVEYGLMRAEKSQAGTTLVLNCPPLKQTTVGNRLSLSASQYVARAVAVGMHQ